MGAPEPPGATAPPRAPAPQGSAPGDRMATILLVDDALPLIEVQKDYLKRTTCRVLSARTGHEALRLCERERPDLIFLDASMPGMDGVEVCRRLRDDPRLRDVPVVLMAEPGRADACRAAGCDTVLEKPVSHSAFLEAVRLHIRLLERQEARIPASLRIEFQARGRTYTAFTKDISPHGLFLKSARPFSVGTQVTLLLRLPDGGEDLRLAGEVRRVLEERPGSHLLPGVGIRFLDLPEGARRRIEAFIEGRLPR